MNWIKKTVFVLAAMFILFVLIQTFGAGLFKAEFLGFEGMLLLLLMGVIELNAITYE